MDKSRRLKQKLPKDRTFEQIKNHYEVEKALALRLKNSTREERKILYAHLYEELFEKVPDHPRLKVRENYEKINTLNQKKFQMVKNFLNDSSLFVEFAPGDCHFASHVARQVKSVYAIDISDQRSSAFRAPANFQLILYDGYSLEFKEDVADVVFSDQLIEHLHPDDVEFHFALVRKILKKGGVYIFRTPHAFFGPHDISRYFSDKPEGFHLKEWTFREVAKILEKVEYYSWQGLIRRGKEYRKIPIAYFNFIEAKLEHLPKKLRGKLSRLFLPRKIIIVSQK